MKNLTDNELQMMDYVDTLILTIDNHKLNETIKSVYYTLILEDFPLDISEYLRIKGQYIKQENPI